jgi:hypothetical protein
MFSLPSSPCSPSSFRPSTFGPNLNEQNIRSVGAKSLMCSARSGFVTGSRLVFPDGERCAQEWKQALISDNVLQTRNSATAIRLARLINARLALMDAELWKMTYEGTGVVVVHAALAAAIKHSLLLGDFLDLVVREQYHLASTDVGRRAQ